MTYVWRQRLEFFVPGKPQTAGSKTAMPLDNGKIVVVESGDRRAKRVWRDDLRAAAQRAAEGSAMPWPTADAIELHVTILRPRPKAHLNAAGDVKPNRREDLPVQRPDRTKHLRAIEDALSRVLWHDDAQIIGGDARKVFADQVHADPRAEGVIVRVLTREVAPRPTSLYRRDMMRSMSA